MRRQIRSGLLVAGLSLMLAVPVYAHSAEENGGNGGMGNGMGTFRSETYNGSNYHVNEVGTHGNYDVSVYGTGTGSQYWGTNTGINDTGRVRTNSYTGNNTNTMTDNRYRATATTTNRGSGWGWLGLLGLFGLAGMRSRNPERDPR